MTRRLADDQDLALRDTRLAQPAIGAVSLGLLRFSRISAFDPQVTGGHSFGELTALCAAGRIDDRSLAQTGTAARCDHGELRPRTGTTARCSPCSQPLDQVAALLGEHRLEVVIANKNAPRQCVLSGPADEIERSRRLLDGPRRHDPPRAGLGGVSQPGRGGRRSASRARRSTRSTSALRRFPSSPTRPP